MLQKDFNSKFNYLLKGLVKDLKIKGTALAKNKRLNSKEVENDFLLPKAVLAFLLEKSVNQYEPLSPEGNELLRKLRKFY